MRESPSKLARRDKTDDGGLVDETGSAAKLQLKRQLADAPWDEQVQMLQPPLPMGVTLGAPIHEDPVQTQAAGATDASTVHSAAASGLQGPSGALPHLDAIQNSFGGHDVSGVQAHVGGAAAEANRTMGAEAYATGNQIAFKQSPSLHTAAHEAAHVVQQRSGVDLPGGVGQAGDSYEKHADAVADAVVAGQSSEALLSGGAGGAAAAGVQAYGGKIVDPAIQMAGGGSTGGASAGSSGGASAGSSGAAALPEATFEEVGGIEKRLVISHAGGDPKVVMHPGFTPLQIAASSRKPFEIAGSVERLTKKYLDPATAESEKPKLLSTIKAEMTKLRKAMVKARGLNIALVSLRDGFEVELGKKICAGASPFNAGKAAVDDMVLKAVNLMQTKFKAGEAPATSVAKVFETLSADDEFKAKITSLGVDPKIGFAGVRGKTYEDVKAVLTSGTLDEKIVHLHNYGKKFLGEDLISEESKLFETVKAQIPPEFGDTLAANITRIRASRKPDAKKVMEFKALCTDYAQAKAQDMDRKMAAQPLENLTKGQLEFLGKRYNVNLSAAAAISGESAKLRKMVELLKAGGITDSGGWKDDATAFDPALNHLSGQIQNVLKAEAEFVVKANTEFKMPLKAGISGTTQRVCGLGVLLGVADIAPVRLAMIGHLQNINAHSFHEVMVAANGYPGCTYTSGKFVPLAPVDADGAVLKPLATTWLATQSALTKDCTGTKDTTLQAEVLLGLKPAPTTG